jgi:hypothetical protein
MLSRLLFAVVGDTRPATIDDTVGYPTNIITQIYDDIEGLAPHPPFVISTGDYAFASEGSPEQAGAQLDLYLQARSGYTGALFPAMGNHECTGATSSNCVVGAPGGVTAIYSTYVQKMLSPLGKTDPYYSVDFTAADGSWTAKLVIVAANAWSSEQESWLDATLARPTTYTFVVRHEPAAATAAPGVAPSEQVMARYPYTLAIVGHSHTYRHDGDTPREVVIGNGGAPLTSKDYGFAVLRQRGDGAIVVDMMQWQTGAPDPAFHFVVDSSGSAVK